jgi:hypothetical protein
MSSDLILVGIIVVSSWFFNEHIQPKQVILIDKYNQSQVVLVDKKYQCPKYCRVNHYHFVYYNDVIKDKNVMTITRPDYKKLKKTYILREK